MGPRANPSSRVTGTKDKKLKLNLIIDQFRSDLSSAEFLQIALGLLESHP